MFKIGDFSKLSQVGSKTLRYYDDIDLLKPAHVDQFTGYRYYSIEQLPRLNRIIALKELGFSLDQIRHVLNDDVSAKQLQGMLLMRQADIERQIADEQQRLLRVQARLQQIIAEGSPSPYDVITRDVPAMTIAAVRDTIPHYSAVGRLYAVLFAALNQQGIQPHGTPFVRYHDGEYRAENPDVEACIAVEQHGTDTEHMAFLTLPVMHVATTIHSGPYATLSAAYAAIMHWLALHNTNIATPNHEYHLRGPATNRSPDDYLTEIQFPITQ